MAPSLRQKAEGQGITQNYIMLSNELFEYYQAPSIRIFPLDKNPLLVLYNMKTQNELKRRQMAVRFM